MRVCLARSHSKKTLVTREQKYFLTSLVFFGPLEGACQVVPEYFFDIKIKGKNLKVIISSLLRCKQAFVSDFKVTLKMPWIHAKIARHSKTINIRTTIFISRQKLYWSKCQIFFWKKQNIYEFLVCVRKPRIRFSTFRSPSVHSTKRKLWI